MSNLSSEIVVVRTAENFSRNLDCEALSFAAANPEKSFQIVASLLEKSLAAKCKKLSNVGDSFSTSWSSLLNDLVLGASGRFTVEIANQILQSRFDLIVLAVALRNYRLDSAAVSALSEEKLEKLSAVCSALCERVAACICARSDSTVQLSVSLVDLELIREIFPSGDCPETFDEKLESAISKQSLDFL